MDEWLAAHASIALLVYISVFIGVCAVIVGLFLLVRWAKGMPKAAFLILALFPLISIFPIPPPVFKNVEKAKQEQRKNKSNAGGKGNDNEDEGK